MKRPCARVLAIAGAVSIVLCATTQASAQSISFNQSGPSNAIWLKDPPEFKRIPELLRQGRTGDAVRQAERLAGLRMPARMRYDALNLLCTARAQHGALAAALAACSQAIALRPRGWQALNNRGTVLLKAGRPADALQDYQRALAAKPNSTVIRHNVEQARARLAPEIASRPVIDVDS